MSFLGAWAFSFDSSRPPWAQSMRQADVLRNCLRRNATVACRFLVPTAVAPVFRVAATAVVVSHLTQPLHRAGKLTVGRAALTGFGRFFCGSRDRQHVRVEFGAAKIQAGGNYRLLVGFQLAKVDARLWSFLLSAFYVGSTARYWFRQGRLPQIWPTKQPWKDYLGRASVSMPFGKSSRVLKHGLGFKPPTVIMSFLFSAGLAPKSELLSPQAADCRRWRQRRFVLPSQSNPKQQSKASRSWKVR
ncbi:hypothetical protein VTI28DRAFT_5853 [Corynascus sepedonium]